MLLGGCGEGLENSGSPRWGVTVLSLFKAIVDHTYDSAEPFSLTPEQQDCAVQSQVGSAQDHRFQDVPLIARLSKVVAAFGKFIVQSPLLEHPLLLFLAQPEMHLR